jgi:hypothetical protein
MSGSTIPVMRQVLFHIGIFVRKNPVTREPGRNEVANALRSKKMIYGRSHEREHLRPFAVHRRGGRQTALLMDLGMLLPRQNVRSRWVSRTGRCTLLSGHIF